SVYEIDGPFFFGIATKFDEMMRSTMQQKPLVRIIRMRKVPFIDSTGIHNLETLIKSSQKEGIQIVLSGVQPGVYKVLVNSDIVHLIGERNICDHISKAVHLANTIVRDHAIIPAWRRNGGATV
ncbi:MAG: sodium-independent anion transporter, partial [Muribaculaceae bacterium]|nr:sodium-independent anion transporter [Muribaculaceae bacterium]